MRRHEAILSPVQLRVEGVERCRIESIRTVRNFIVDRL